MSDERISRLDALKRMAIAEEENDVCPECGEDFLGVDMDGAGDLYFIHEEKGATVDGCTHELEEVEGVDF